MQSYNIQIVIKGMNQSSPVFRALNSDFDSINKKIRGVAPESDKARQAITGSMSGASQSVRKFDSDIGNASGTVSKFGGVAGTAFKAVGIAVAGAALAIGAFAVKAFQAASNVSEAQNKVNEVFEESREVISNFAKQASGDVGLSRRAALEATGSFGNLFDQLGFGKEKVADMSIAMVRLAADFGSFHNADIEEVILAQTAAFRGEYDAVQRFVPTINAAAVEQRALEQTGKRATKELTLQEKAFATLTLLVEGSGKAMGDFDRTSTGAANSMRIIRARFEDITGTLGEKLLPIVEPLISRFAQALPGALDTTLGFLDRVGRRWDEVKKAFSGEPIKGEITIAVEGEAEETVSKLTPIQEVMKGIGENARIWKDSITTVKEVIEGKWEPHESVLGFHLLVGETALVVKNDLVPALKDLQGESRNTSSTSQELDADFQFPSLPELVRKIADVIRVMGEWDRATEPVMSTIDEWGRRVVGVALSFFRWAQEMRDSGGVFTNLDRWLRGNIGAYDAARSALDLLNRAYERLEETIDRVLGRQRQVAPAPAWTPPPPIFGPRPEPAPDHNQGFQTQWGQWREIPGMMNQPVSITAHGKEVIGRPPFPDQQIAPSIAVNGPLVNIANMIVSSEFDRDALLDDVEQAMVRGIASAYSSGNRTPHALRPRIG